MVGERIGQVDSLNICTKSQIDTLYKCSRKGEKYVSEYPDLVVYCEARNFDRERYFAYRIVKAVKCELGDIDALYKQFYDMINTPTYNGYYQTMLFTREPEETPIKDRAMRMDVPEGIVSVEITQPPHYDW